MDMFIWKSSIETIRKGVMEDNTEKSETGRKKYEKPVLTIIDLAAEEVLAIGCKMDAGGSAFGNPGACTQPTFCTANGS